MEKNIDNIKDARVNLDRINNDNVDKINKQNAYTNIGNKNKIEEKETIHKLFFAKGFADDNKDVNIPEINNTKEKKENENIDVSSDKNDRNKVNKQKIPSNEREIVSIIKEDTKFPRELNKRIPLTQLVNCYNKLWNGEYDSSSSYIESDSDEENENKEK